VQPAVAVPPPADPCPGARTTLDRAQADWLRFESVAAWACGNPVSIRLANERIADLQATWVGERFW
jgi:hypothetical protein